MLYAKFIYRYILIFLATSAIANAATKCKEYWELLSHERIELKVQAQHARSAKIPESEIYSLEHQDDVLQAAEDKNFRKFINIDANQAKSQREGILDSDRGKLEEYKKLLRPIDVHNKLLLEDSNRLLNVISGKPSALSNKAQQALRELLDENGHKGKWLLSPDLNNEEIRKGFQEAPVLSGFLHELPGILDAIKAFERGFITKEAFKDRLAANLFHNGPAKGFWGFITHKLVPDSLNKAGTSPATKNILRGTVFSNEDGKIIYPSVMNAAAAQHLILDRLSQGTGGGILKIYHEIGGDPVKSIRDMVNSNPQGTMEQLDALVADINALTKETPRARLALQLYAQNAKARVRQYQAALRKRIINLATPEGNLDESTLQIDGVIYDSSNIYPAFEKVIQETEASLQPMRALTR